MTDLMKRYEIEMNWTLEQAKKDHKVGLFLSAYREWLEAQLTWRDVSEDLPEEDDKVLAISEFFNGVIMVYFCGGKFRVGLGAEKPFIGDVTKWLPIPKETTCGQS